MFLILSKIAFFLLRPSNVILFLLLGGVIGRLAGFRRLGWGLVTAGTLLMLAAGFGPLGNILFLPLESRFPTIDTLDRPPDGIVLLGGAVDTVISERHDTIVLAEAGERVTATAALALRFPDAKVLLSGGRAVLTDGELREAETTFRLLSELGVPAAQMIIENDSRNTRENAVMSKRIAAPEPGERWLLVTSAYHMPRAIGVFRKAGWADIEAYPVDFRTTGDFAPFTSVSKGLRYTDIATREWIGLIAYFLTGRTEALFPGPRAARP